jgi:hypothetical protein
MAYSPTAGTITPGDHVQVWGNPEVGNAVGIVTADNDTGSLVVHFDKLDDERLIPVERIHPVYQQYAYRPTRSGTAYLPKDEPRADMSMETFGKLYPQATVRKLERGYVRDIPGGWLHLADRDDATPQHMTYPSGYDANCGWCWLNAGHTEAAHESALEMDRKADAS